MMGRQWHQLDHVQIICTSLQIANHASITHRSVLYTSLFTKQAAKITKETSTVILKKNKENLTMRELN